jgi:hypothetical protein
VDVNVGLEQQRCTPVGTETASPTTVFDCRAHRSPCQENTPAPIGAGTVVRPDHGSVGKAGGVAGSDLKHRRILLARAERTPPRNVESGSIPTTHGLPCHARMLIRVAAALLGEPIRPAAAPHERLRLDELQLAKRGLRAPFTATRSHRMSLKPLSARGVKNICRILDPANLEAR